MAWRWRCVVAWRWRCRWCLALLPFVFGGVDVEQQICGGGERGNEVNERGERREERGGVRGRRK